MPFINIYDVLSLLCSSLHSVLDAYTLLSINEYSQVQKVLFICDKHCKLTCALHVYIIQISHSCLQNIFHISCGYHIESTSVFVYE